MRVAAQDGVATVAAWGEIVELGLDDATPAPEVDASPDRLVMVQSMDGAFDLENTGSADLRVHGLEVSDDRLHAALDEVDIPPGGSARVAVTFADDGEPLDGTVCLATDDPDEPTLEIPVTTTSGTALAVGEPAVDFTLEDVDGVAHTLSDHVGQPILLVYFATW
jgi:hypothetical protein